MRTVADTACRVLIALAYGASAISTAHETAQDTGGLRPSLPIDEAIFDRQAKAWLRKRPSPIPPHIVQSLADLRPPASASVQYVDEIRVYSAPEPEDYAAAKLPPMLAFHARLERSRPRTPKEITQGALCLIGLCGGVPSDLPIGERTKGSSQQSFMPNFKSGTLQ